MFTGVGNIFGNEFLLKSFLIDRLKKTMSQFGMDNHGCANNGISFRIFVIHIHGHIFIHPQMSQIYTDKFTEF